MVACDATLQTLAFEIESSWAEDVDTMTHGVQLCAPVEFSGITHEMLAPERVTSSRLDGTKGIPGPFSNATISFSCYLTGHGSATTGAVTVNSLGTLLGYTLGASAAASSSGTTLTGGTVTVPTTTSSGTYSAGALCFIGALGDGDGEGQAYLISGHSTTSLTLLNDMAGAPANGAVLYNPALAYPAASACSMTGVRMRAQSADMQYILPGGFPTAFGITGTGPGEVVKLNFTYQFSWVEPVAATFPTTPTADAFSPSPNTADGSYHLSTVGTSTRSLISPRAFSIDYQLATMPVTGGNGVNAYQTITGATRGRDKIFCNLVVDALGADATPLYWDEWLTNPYKQLIATLNSKLTTYQATAIALRNMVYAGPRPSQIATNGRNTIPLRFECLGSGTTTNDLTRAPLLIAMA